MPAGRATGGKRHLAGDLEQQLGHDRGDERGVVLGPDERAWRADHVVLECAHRPPEEIEVFKALKPEIGFGLGVIDIKANEAVGHGDCIHIGRGQVGVITSATRSPILGKTIALARIDVMHASPGTEVEIGKLDGHQKRLPATIVPLSHYDPQKTRPRS